ncbi:MAG: MarR family transcriptional regulator [Alphaproteobacteria bacterium]|nr:MarR family transcriptional regulator [Alphaproteobacteria bacterium]
MKRSTVRPKSDPAQTATTTVGGAEFHLADLLDCLGRWARSAQFTRGLNPAQWESLRYLERANRFSRTPGALAKYLGTTRGTASQTVRALVQKGYLSRIQDSQDRRVVSLEITTAGAALLQDDPLHRLDQTLMSRLDSETASAITESLSQVMACFQSAALGQSFGTCEHCGYYARGSGALPAYCKMNEAKLAADELASLCVNFIHRDVGSAAEA